MFVTAHAMNRAHDRMGPLASLLIEQLEDIIGETGTFAYIMGELPGKARSADGSNGELVIAVAVDGSVETLFFRRASQDNSPAFFGARAVIDRRVRNALRKRGAS
jgi:hypothetical protein